jgi:hypothetical protein
MSDTYTRYCQLKIVNIQYNYIIQLLSYNNLSLSVKINIILLELSPTNTALLLLTDCKFFSTVHALYMNFQTLNNYSTTSIISNRSQLIDFKTLDNYSTSSIIDDRSPADCSTLNNYSTISIIDDTDNSRTSFVDCWLLLEV